jgi:AcrR family transcriptional regulator
MAAGSDVDPKAAEPRRRGRPRADAPRASPELLLETAEALLRAEGPAVTIAEIAAAADVTKPIVYHHIGNKDAVVRALAERLADRIAAAVERATSVVERPREGVAAFIEAYLGVVQHDRHIFLYVSAGGTGGDRVDEALQLADRAATPLAEGLAVFRVQQGADPAVASTWAYSIIGMLHYATLRWIRDPKLSATTLADQLGELLWSGVGGGVGD